MSTTDAWLALRYSKAIKRDMSLKQWVNKLCKQMLVKKPKSVKEKAVLSAAANTTPEVEAVVTKRMLAHTLVSYNRQREPETDQTGEVAAVDEHGSTGDESDADGDSKVPGKPSRIQRNCTWCHRVHHVITKTSYKCAQCDLPFCGGYAETNCFAKHQAAVGLPAKDSWMSSPTHVAEECACCIRNGKKKLKRKAKKPKGKQASKSKKRKLAKGRASLPPC
jgi:hypothetical protein